MGGRGGGNKGKPGKKYSRDSHSKSGATKSRPFTKSEKRAALDRDDVFDLENPSPSSQRAQGHMESFDDANGGDDDENDGDDQMDDRMRSRMEAFDDASGGSEGDDADSYEYVGADAEDGQGAEAYGHDAYDSGEEQDAVDGNYEGGDYDEDAGSDGSYDSDQDQDQEEDAPQQIYKPGSRDAETMSLADRLSNRAYQEEEAAGHGKVGDKRARTGTSQMSARMQMKAKRAKDRVEQQKESKMQAEVENPTRYGIGHRKQQEEAHLMFKTKVHKNAPAEQRSNKPVRRFRDHNIDHSLAKKTTVDPRFSSAQGEVKDRLFYKSYDFLNDYQEDEIKKLGHAMKKSKSVDRKTQLKEEVRGRAQNLSDRKRAIAVNDRMEVLRQEEKEKVAGGKKAFFLKRADKKAVAMDIKFDELKKAGKLKTYMQKRRVKNAKSDRRWMPESRQQEE